MHSTHASSCTTSSYLRQSEQHEGMLLTMRQITDLLEVDHNIVTSTFWHLTWLVQSTKKSFLATYLKDSKSVEII